MLPSSKYKITEILHFILIKHINQDVTPGNYRMDKYCVKVI